MVLITVASDVTQTERLQRSAEKHGYDLRILLVDWKGFGTKLLAVRQYLQSQPDITEFVFCDAYDVICMKPWEEMPERINLCLSAERGCWPDAHLREQYVVHDSETGYDFVNSGLYYAKSEYFIGLTGDVQAADDDQRFMTSVYLAGKAALNFACDYFQSYSFIREGEYTYDEEQPFNNVTGTTACLWHSNGKTDTTLLEKYV